MAVREEIYRGSGEVARSTPLPTADAETFGASIGRGIGQVGGELHKAKVRELERQYQADYSTALVGLADFVKQADVARNAAREEAPLDGAGHAERVAGDLKALSENYLGTIANKRIRERVMPQVESLIGRVTGDEDGWQRGRRAVAIGQNAADAANGLASQLQNSPDPAVLETSLEAGEAFIESTAAGNPALADKIRRYWRDTVATGFAQGLIEANPAGAIDVLNSGRLDSLFDKPDTKAALLNQAQTALRMHEADLRRVQAQAEAQLRERVNIFKQGLTAGNEPDEQEFAGLITQAETLGLASVVTDLKLAQNDLRIKRETRNWTEDEWQSAITALQAKGDKRTAEEDIRLAALDRLRPGAVQRLSSNPHEWSAGAGMPPPQVDVWGQPTRQEIDALTAWARAARQTAGLNYTPFLNQQQLADARDRVNQGPAQQVDVALHLRALFGPQDAAEIARQIDGGNEGLQLMVRMIPQVAQDYKRGLGVLDRNPKLFLQAEANAIFAGYGDGIPLDQRDAMYAAAKAIAAGMADRQGLGDLSEDPEQFGQIFRIALDRAAGQRGAAGARTGGFGKWNGRAVWLPSDMAGSDFARRISRASPEQWGRAGGGKPHYRGPNGRLTPVPDDWYSRFKSAPLITIAPGIYRPLGRDGRPLAKADGSPWQFDVGRLP